MRSVLNFLFLALSLFGYSAKSYGQADPYTNQPALYTFSTPVGSTQSVFIPGGNNTSASVPLLPNSVTWMVTFPATLTVGTPVLPPAFYTFAIVSNLDSVTVFIRNQDTIPPPFPLIPQDYIFEIPVTGVVSAVFGQIYAKVYLNSGFELSVGNNDLLNDAGNSPIIFSAIDTLPIANADAATTPEDVAITIPVLPNDNFGSDGPSTGTIAITDQPSNGTAMVNNGGTPNDPTDDQVVYTPNPNFNGIDTLIYQICDAEDDCDTAMVIVNVTPVNDPPVAVDDYYTMVQGSPDITLIPLNADYDLDGDELLVYSINGVVLTHGIAQTIPVLDGTVYVSTTGGITFSPAPSFVGVVTFPYVITDQNAGFATANEIITISGSPLSVRFISFDVNCEANRKAKLQWIVASEKDVEKYIVEKSVNGINFEVIGVVAPTTASGNTNTYQFVDDAANSGRVYYRIKQKDLSGQLVLSTIATSTCIAEAGFVNLYPNPTENRLYFKLNSKSAKELSIWITDALSRTVSSVKHYEVESEEQTFELDTDMLSDGTYLFNYVIDDQKTGHIKFVKRQN